MARNLVVRRSRSFKEQEKEAWRAQGRKDAENEFAEKERALRRLVKECETITAYRNEEIAALRREIVALQQYVGPDVRFKIHQRMMEASDASKKTVVHRPQENIDPVFSKWLKNKGWRIEQRNSLCRRTVICVVIDEETGDRIERWEIDSDRFQERGHPEALIRTIQSWIATERKTNEEG